MSKILPDKISIIQIKVYKTNLNVTEEYLNNPVKPESLTVNFGHNIKVDFDNKAFMLRLEAIIESNDDKDEKLGVHAEYGIEYHFHVDNLDDFVVNKDGDRTLDSLLGTTLLSIAFSTSRGIILERTQGTYLDGVILPVINPKELLMNPKNDK